MKKFSEFICKNKKIVIILSCILLVLSFVGMKMTKVNYDILVYLPQDIETIKGQNILTNDFDMGSYSVAVVDNLSSKEIIKLEDKIKNVKGVNKVVSLYDAFGTSIPLDILPSDVVNKVHNNNTDILFITFPGSTSSEETINAVKEIRTITDGKVSQGGMSSMVLDTMNLSESEIAIYIIIAVCLCILVLELSLDSYIIPVLLLANIGCAIVFNLGSNIFLGQISYITKALVAVLQLGVTTDFSIFLYHSYENKKRTMKNREDAMKEAIAETFTSVSGSSLTTIAGFLVLCAMQLTLGKDLGIVMAKGVFLGVVCVLTLFPSLLLVFDNVVEKTKHKMIVPDFSKLNKFVIKHHIALFVCFLILLVPSYLAYSKVEVYYKLDKSLPDTLESIKSNKILKDNYNIVSPEIILVNKDMKSDSISDMVSEIENVDGMDFVLSFSKIKDLGISEEMLSEDLAKIVKNDKYQLMIINSTYDIATPELNDQITKVNDIVKKYDENGIVAGEGPLMKDLVKICDIDFNNVNTSSIVCIFLILFIVLKSFSLPFLLITSIEFAIFTNMSISYFSGTVLPFIAPIVLGTIQLGATIDYAILMTTTYLEKRKNGVDKNEAMLQTLNYCGNSIFVSGMCFFAATFGVGIYSKIEMIGSLCTLISRGAIISMIVVITVLPSILLIFDKLIIKTTIKGRKQKVMKTNVKKNLKKAAVCSMVLMTVLSTCPFPVFAMSKNETVYSKLNNDGSVKSVLVNEQLINDSKLDKIEDYSELKDIINVGNDNNYSIDNNKITWDASGKDVFYHGTTDKTLPITASIEYKLNDEKMNVDDMIGKSGKVSISLNYKNNDKHTVMVNGRYETLYTPFVVTMGTILDSDNNSNINVVNGKVISNGTKNIIAGISAPGLYESLDLKELQGLDTITISYETTKFELPSMYSVVTSKLFESGDLKIFDKMDSIYGQVNELQTNMDNIDNGAKKVADGSSKLRQGLQSSIDSLAKDKSDALTKEQVTGIQKQTVDNVNKSFTDAYKKQIADNTWASVQYQLANSQDKTVENYVKETVTSILASYLGGETNLKYYGGCAQENVQACQALNAAGYDAKKVAAFQQSVATSVAANAKKITGYVAKNVSDSVSVNVSQQAANQTASSVAATLAPTVANTVKSESLKTIVSSLNTLYKNVELLDNGMTTLSSGISKYNVEGINKVSSLVNNELKTTSSKVKQLTKLSEEYKSFAGNKVNGETKLVLVVDSKKVSVENKNNSTENTKLTLWQRIVNLFK